MFRKNDNDDDINRYIRERIHQVRLEIKETQDDLAETLKKNRASVSDLERGRVSVSAADLALIAAHFEKPISYFYPPRVTVNKDQLSQREEELIFLFSQLPNTQQRISIEYIKQQVEITTKAIDQEFNEQYAINKSKKNASKFSITTIDLNSENLEPGKKGDES